MVFSEKEINLKDGRTAILRNARLEDAEELIEYLKITAAETPFLVREPEEVIITREQEEYFIRRNMEDEKGLMLIATIDGKHAGNASFSGIAARKRYAHRCSVAIALYQKYCGLGLGRQMFAEILERAKACGYEQVELEVSADNEKAIQMYKSFGFEVYGKLKNDMKFKDGTYADSYLMVKYF